MECELLQIADGWDVEVHYKPKPSVMEPEIVMVYLTSPDSESLDITDVWQVLVPNLISQLVMKTVFYTITENPDD
jgi:hypothetical protein